MGVSVRQGARTVVRKSYQNCGAIRPAGLMAAATACGCIHFTAWAVMGFPFIRFSD